MRPVDWSVVGFDSDPVPGDPVVVRQGGNDYVGVADAIRRCADSLRALDAGGSRGSESVEALLETRDDILSKVEVAEARYRSAGNALVEYAGALERAQTDSLNALAAARSAQLDVDEAVARAGRMRESAGEYPEQGDGADDRARYERAATTADADASAARGRVQAQRQVILNAMGERDTAAVKAQNAIDGAGDDGLGDSWWDDWGAKIASWVAKICDIVSAITGVLGLLVCWIPVIGQALAGVLFAISAISGIVAAIAHVALAVGGEESWMEALISVAFAALGCLGLGAMKGVGKVMCKAMAKQVENLAKVAGSSKSLLGKIGLRTLLRPGGFGRIMAQLSKNRPAFLNRNSMIGKLGEEIMLIKPGSKLQYPASKFGGSSHIRIPDLNFNVFGNRIIGEVKFWRNIDNVEQLRDFARIAASEGADGTLHLFHPAYYTQSVEGFAKWATSANSVKDGINVAFHHIEDFLGLRMVAPVIAGSGVGHMVAH